MSPDLLDRACRTIERHARSRGFDLSRPGDRLLLARQADLPRDVMERLFGDDAVPVPSVPDLVQACLALQLDVAELLSESRRDFHLLAVQPFFGGEPMLLSVPRQWSLVATPRDGSADALADEDLFYIRTDRADEESGLAPRSLVIARRTEEPPVVGAAYVLEREAGYLIRRCTARLTTGAWVMAAFQGAAAAAPLVLAPALSSRLHLVTDHEPDRGPDGPWIVGRVLGVYQPEPAEGR
jgi:hypothetical protein